MIVSGQLNQQHGWDSGGKLNRRRYVWQQQPLTVLSSLNWGHLYWWTGRGEQSENGTVMTVSECIGQRRMGGGWRGLRLMPGSHRMQLSVQLPLKITEGAPQNTKLSHWTSRTGLTFHRQTLSKRSKVATAAAYKSIFLSSFSYLHEQTDMRTGITLWYSTTTVPRQVKRKIVCRLRGERCNCLWVCSCSP